MDHRRSAVGRRGVLLGGALGAVSVFAGRSALAGRGPSMTGWHFPEHRGPARLEADSRHARRQLDALSSPAGRERAEQIIDRLRERQATAPRGQGVPFDRYRPSGAAEVLVARGQLTVRLGRPGSAAAAGAARGAALDAEAVTAELASLGYTWAGGRSPRASASRPAAHAPITGVFQGDKTPAQLARDAAALRDRGRAAGLNAVVPLGYVIKGDDHPVRTDGLAPLRPVSPAPVRVALIDTGVAGPREDGWLVGVAAEPEHVDPLDVLPPLGRLDWGGGHGTFTAGIVRRVAPRCEIVAYRFTGGDGLGTDQDVADLLLLAARQGHEAGVPTIINASLGTPAVAGVPPLAMRHAVGVIAATYPDVLIVASAGNLGTAEPMYPAAFDGVVAVGALTHDGRPAPFSSHGPWVRCSAIGVGVVSTFVPGVAPPEPDPRHPDQTFGADAWALWSGTSFTAPQISGAVARLCGDDPALTPRAALERLLAGRSQLSGYGSVLELLPGTPI
jgi:thermitase